MKELHIGRILMENRQKRGITQEKLAEYIGVSKASVSKWETGTTYPDITLLPRLATFFDISIDELMGYEPQITNEDIRKLYRQLSIAFASQPFDEVMDRCRELTKKYFSCAQLLFQIGALYVNHSMLAGNPEKAADIIEEAMELFVRVKKENDDIELAKQALHMEAFCLLQLGRATEVIDLLEPLEIDFTSPEPLLAKAYQSVGNPKEAKRILQIGIYLKTLELLSFLPAYMEVCTDDYSAFESSYQRAMDISGAFHLDKLHPSILLSLYLPIAQGFIVHGKEEKALDVLEQYTQLAVSDIYPLRLHGDSYFYLLDEWLERTLTLGSDLPRDESLVQKSMTEAVANNPIFQSLADNLRFQRIVQRLRENEEV